MGDDGQYCECQISQIAKILQPGNFRQKFVPPSIGTPATTPDQKLGEDKLENEEIYKI